jgi:RimJ/RimL family protein N-acetyltransferase
VAEIRVTSPFPQHSLPLVWQWAQSFRDRVADDFAPKTLDEWMLAEFHRPAAHRTWAVHRGDELGGFVVCEPWNPVCVSMHVVFKKSFWGRGTTERALRQIITQVFDKHRTIIAVIFADNHGMRSLLRRLGGHELKGQLFATQRGGQIAGSIVAQLRQEDYLHAILSSSSPLPVSGRLNRRGRAEQPQQDLQEHLHPDLHPAADGGAGGPVGNDQRPHAEPARGHRPHEDRGVGGDQPEL